MKHLWTTTQFNLEACSQTAVSTIKRWLFSMDSYWVCALCVLMLQKNAEACELAWAHLHVQTCCCTLMHI